MEEGTALAAGDGPKAVVRLPDGQVVEALVRARRQEADGSWWYELEVPLYARTETRDGRLRAEPEPVKFWAPGIADVVMAMPGEEYSSVPTWRHPTARTRSKQRRKLGRPRQPFPWE